jgi:hypothetical protein
MRLTCRTGLPSLALLTVLAFAPAAHAQSDADRATARQLGQEGFQALDAKDFKTADDRLRRADKLVHAPTLLLGLARALAGERKFVEAQETYQRIIREGVAPGAPEAFRQAIESAKTEVTSVAPFIGRVTITVTAPVAGDLPNEKVTVDDIPVNSASLGIARTIDPGEHVLVVTADGYKRIESRFTVPDGGSVDAPVTLEKDPNYVPPAVPTGTTGPTGTTTGVIAPPPPPGGEQPPPPAGSPSLVPWVVMGIGGVGLLTGAITGALALGDHSTLSGPCKGGSCPSSESGELSSYHTVGGVSTVAFIIGGVGVAAGVVLLLVQPKGSGGAPPPPATGLQVTPVIGLGSLGATGTF